MNPKKEAGSALKNFVLLRIGDEEPLISENEGKGSGNPLNPFSSFCSIYPKIAKERETHSSFDETRRYVAPNLSI